MPNHLSPDETPWIYENTPANDALATVLILLVFFAPLLYGLSVVW